MEKAPPHPLCCVRAYVRMYACSLQQFASLSLLQLADWPSVPNVAKLTHITTRREGPGRAFSTIFFVRSRLEISLLFLLGIRPSAENVSPPKKRKEHICCHSKALSIFSIRKLVGCQCLRVLSLTL